MIPTLIKFGLVALVLVVAAIAFVVYRLMSSVRSYSGVTCFEGLPGSGKSFSLAEIAVKRMAEGWTVYTNEGFDVVGTLKYKSFEELCDIPDGSVILLDEAPLYFNARKWQDFPDGVLYRLTQVRKDGLQFYYSTIDEKMCDINLRRITFWTWHCESDLWGKVTRPQSFIRYRTPPIDRCTSSTKPDRRERVKLDPVVCDAYDTLAKVAVRRSGIVSTAADAEVWVRASDVRDGSTRTPGGAGGPPGATGSSARRRVSRTPVLRNGTK